MAQPRHHLWWCIGLAALCVAPAVLLWPYRHAAFVADDRFFAFRDLPTNLFAIFTSSWGFPLNATSGYRPVVITSYVLTRAWTDNSPFYYHLTNFFLHGLNAALLAVIGSRLGRSRIAGLIAGGLFAIHPSTHENVMWISGRTYVLATCFALGLTAWTVTRERRPPWRQHAVGALLFAGALCSYEPLVILPVAVFLAALAPTVTRPTTGAGPRRLWDAAAFTLPYVGLLAVYFALRWTFITPPSADAAYTMHSTTALLPQIKGNVLFLTMCLTAVSFIGVAAAVSTAGVASFVAAGLLDRSRRGIAAGLLVMTAIAFLPFLTVHGSTWRFSYLPLAAFLGAVGLGAQRLLSHGRLLVRGLEVVMLCFVSVRLARQYQIRGEEWRHAGNVVESFLDQTTHLVPPASGGALYFVDPPRYYRSAYCFITAIHETVERRYPPGAVFVDASWDRPLDAVIAKVRGEPRARPAWVLTWSPMQERLSVAWSSTGAPDTAGAGGVRNAATPR